MRTHIRLTALALALVLALSLCPAALADRAGTTGSAGDTYYFYCNAENSRAKITFMQKEGLCAELSYTHLIDGLLGQEEEWGKYHITCSRSGSSFTTDWDKTFGGETFTISLPSAGVWKITVTPFTGDEMTASWTLDQFSYWVTYPEWWIDSAIGCTCTASDPSRTVSQPPAAQVSVGIYVNQVDIDTGDTLGRWIEYVSTGSSSISAGTTPSGYSLISDSRQQVYVDASGRPDRDSVYFYYRKNNQTVSVNIYVKQVNQDTGAILSSRIVSVSTGDNVVAAGAAPSGFRLVSGSSQHVYVDEYGRPDKDTVYFYYRRESSSTSTVPQSSGGIWAFPTDTVPLTLTDYSRSYIRPRCGPGNDYKTFASKSDNGTQLYQISQISRIRAHFISGSWVYVTFNYNGRRSGGFYQRSQFSPDIPWSQIVSYDMSGGERGTVTSNVTPHNGPGSEYGDYPSCGLRAGESVRVYMESNGWYFCNFYNDRSNKYGWVWLWVPAGSVRLN